MGVFLLNSANMAIVVAQLVERSPLSTPENRSSNPVIGQFYLLSNVLKDKNRREMAQFLKEKC